MKALGFEKTSTIGHNRGRIIALQMAVNHPEVLEYVLLHEVPTACLLPNSSVRMDGAFEIIYA